MSRALHRPSLRLPPLVRRWARGFTLAETVVAMTVGSMMLGMITTFYLESTKKLYYNEQKFSISADMRNLTTQLSQDGRQADFFAIYTDYSLGNRTSTNQELPQANSGDFLVLVTFGTPVNSTYFNVKPVNEIVGYYRQPYTGNQTDTMSGTSTTIYPIRRFDLTVANGGVPANHYLETSSLLNLPAGAVQCSLESLLPGNTSAVIQTHKIIVDFSEGLSDNRLFHNFWGKSVMVNGKIYHGNNYESASDTYNFTISPRG